MENDTNNSYPVVLMVPRPKNPSRWLALATLLAMIPKVIILIPHFIILAVLQILAIVAGVYAQFAVLFTGSYPEGAFKMVRGVFQWRIRVLSYLFGLVDKYPPFSLD